MLISITAMRLQQCNSMLLVLKFLYNSDSSQHQQHCCMWHPNTEEFTVTQ